MFVPRPWFFSVSKDGKTSQHKEYGEDIKTSLNARSMEKILRKLPKD